MMRPSWSSLLRALRTHPRHRVVLAGTLATAAVLYAGLGITNPLPLPTSTAACCTGPVSVGDTNINTSGGADKDFFVTQAGPPNAVFLLGNNESMQDFALGKALPDGTATGCSDATLVSQMNWFNKASPDPALNGENTFDDDKDFSPSTLHFFDKNQFYLSYGTRLPQGGRDSPATVASDFRTTTGYASATDACNKYWSFNTAMRDACVSCMAPAGKGWYRGDKDGNGNRRWVVSGRVLNVRPPKFVVARKVLKDVISEVQNLRMGVAIFSESGDYFDPIRMLTPIKPPCNKSFPAFSEADLQRNDLMKSINTVKFDNGERSIGEAIYSIGAFYSSQKQDNIWSNWFRNDIGTTSGSYPGGPSGGWATDPNDFLHLSGYTWNQPFEAGGEQKSVCYSCQASSIIALSDGQPEADNSVPVFKMLTLLKAKGAKHPDGTALTFNPGTGNDATKDPGGVNYCDKFGSTKVACDYNASPSGGDAKNKNFMDDVAFFLANMDLRNDLDGEQTVRTYTIGYGDNSAMLQSVALAGKGKFYRADDPGELRDAIMNAIGDLRETSTSFASATLSSVQTGGMQNSIYVPRFIPRRSRPYEGHLYRFFYYSEFTQGCDAAKAKATGGDPLDLNGDKDCEDTFYLDTPASYTLAEGSVPAMSTFAASNIVQENVAGDWVKAATATKNAEGKLVGGTPAVPFWDLNTTLGKRSASAACAQLGSPGTPISPTGGRCIFTMVDRDNDGKYTEADNPPIPFDLANEAMLRSYILAGGDTFCRDIFAKRTKVWTGTAAEQQECSQNIIAFIRGVDVFDYDGDSNVTEDRPCADNDTQSCKLGDIFHSTPVVVEPPVEPFLCDLGLSGQCLRTLYADYAAEDALPASEASCASGGPKPCYAATPMNPPLKLKAADYGAYGQYLTNHGRRDRIVLVGANDGMLHAVHAGKAIVGKTKANLIDDIYDLGTGQELWAFIPPDLLPKLGMLANGHEYFVDGTAMVRDIWADGAAGGTPDVKEASEFRTMAVITERGGGQRYSGLDVTDPYAMFKPAEKPFRWMYPNACDPEAATFGQSWMNFAPKPPPIGPVRIKDSSNARGWDERWAVFVNGGYSSDLSRGRGVYLLDAWTGQKLWSFAADPRVGGGTATGSAYQQSVADMMMPVAAAPAMIDVGKAANLQADQDGFFDTVVVGDTGGQVWTLRMFEPGDMGSGTVNNWYGARSFELAREDLASATSPRNMFKKTPFFNIASTTLQPETGWLRAFLGSGDKQNLRSTEGTACGPDNLLACVRMKCDVRAELSSTIGGVTRTSVVEYNDGVLVRNYGVPGGAPVAACSAGKMNLTQVRIDCHAALGSGSYTYPASGTTSPVGGPLLGGAVSECSIVSGQWVCTSRKLDTGASGDLELGSDLALVPRNTYVGYHSYGGTRTFNDQASALTYDSKRLTDVHDDCAGATCGLKDVTIPTAKLTTAVINGKSVSYITPANLATIPKAPPTGAGWFMRYNTVDEKTAAGSSILGGIVFWPSFVPPGAALAACQPLGSGDTGRSWQQDIISGWPDQAESFKVTNAAGAVIGYIPSKTRSVVSPPPEPASTISLSKNGTIRYGVSQTGVGDPPSQETLRSTNNLASDISWVELPRNAHICRHQDTNACQ